MNRHWSQIFLHAGQSVLSRRSRAKSDLAPIRALIALLRSLIRKGDTVDKDEQEILRAAQEAFQHTYPRQGEWEGAELLNLLTQMCDRLEEVVSGRPVHIYELEEAQAFCVNCRAQLIVNGRK